MTVCLAIVIVPNVVLSIFIAKVNKVRPVRYQPACIHEISKAKDRRYLWRQWPALMIWYLLAFVSGSLNT
jgi:hypothetical protein